MGAEANVAALRWAIAAFNDPATRNDYFRLYDDDVVLHGYAENIAPGLAGAKAFYQASWGALGDMKVVIEDIIASGDRLACRYVLCATHVGPFMGVPATGRRLAVKGMTFLRFANGRCVERWQGMDKLMLLEQLGALPVREPGSPTPGR